MAIRNYIENNKKYFEVYLHTHDARGARIQRKRRGIETLRKAETIEFELKRELMLIKEQKVSPSLAIVSCSRLSLMAGSIIK